MLSLCKDLTRVLIWGCHHINEEIQGWITKTALSQNETTLFRDSIPNGEPTPLITPNCTSVSPHFTIVVHFSFSFFEISPLLFHSFLFPPNIALKKTLLFEGSTSISLRKCHLPLAMKFSNLTCANRSNREHISSTYPYANSNKNPINEKVVLFQNMLTK